MDKDAIRNWADSFVANCEVGGERVPLDRVIAAHLTELSKLRSAGLTWQGIAAIITKAGGRRANGRLITADQLRADTSRLLRRLEGTQRNTAVPRPQVPNSLSLRTPSKRLDQRVIPRFIQDPPPALTQQSLAVSPKDVSSEEIAAALGQLKTSS